MRLRVDGWMGRDDKMIYVNKHSDVYKPANEYELEMMHQLDKSDKVAEWYYEKIQIKYWGNKSYFPDFYVHFRNGDKMIIELKSREMVRKHRRDDVAKWKAAEQYCKLYNMQFKVVKNEKINEFVNEYLR